MKKIIAALMLILPVYAVNAQYQTHTSTRGGSYYMNPIFAGDYPDPSILRDGNDYYIVNSSFNYYSTDGKNWIKTHNSLEVSGYNHNVLGGFLSLRIGLCSIGKGAVSFRNFEYHPIK